MVVDGVRIEETAAGLCLLRKVADAALVGSLEEHVLEGVRKTLLVIRLVEISGLHVRHDRDGRGRTCPPVRERSGRSEALFYERCSDSLPRARWLASTLASLRAIPDGGAQVEDKKRAP